MCANTHICANTHMCANTQMCASAHTCVTEHGQIYQRQLIPHNLLNHQNEEIVIQKQNYKLFMNVFDLKYSFSQKLMKEFCICMNTNCMSIIYQEGKHLYRVPQRVQSPSHRGYATDQRASPESSEPPQRVQSPSHREGMPLIREPPQRVQSPPMEPQP